MRTVQQPRTDPSKRIRQGCEGLRKAARLERRGPSRRSERGAVILRMGYIDQVGMGSADGEVCLTRRREDDGICAEITYHRLRGVWEGAEGL